MMNAREWGAVIPLDLQGIVSGTRRYNEIILIKIFINIFLVGTQLLSAIFMYDRCDAECL